MIFAQWISSPLAAILACPKTAWWHHWLGDKQKHTYCEQKSLQLTLKKSKNDTCLALGPYLLSSCLKKKKFVSAASNRSGFFFAITTSLSRSSRLSRPRQNALVILSDQFGLPLAWTESISKETLKLNALSLALSLAWLQSYKPQHILIDEH